MRDWKRLVLSMGFAAALFFVAVACTESMKAGPGADAQPPAGDTAVPGDLARPDEDVAEPSDPQDVPAPTEDVSPDAADVPPAPDDVDDTPDVDEPVDRSPFVVPVGQEDETFHVGPYLGHTTTTTVAISWETLAAGDTVVEYGLDADYGLRYEGDPGTLHHAVLTDLEPATVYHYRACTNDTCTGDLTFATAPLRGRTFRMAVYGDSRSDPAMHRAIVDNIIADQPAVVLNSGDIVADGDQRHEYKEMHFDPLRQLGHHLPVYVAIGNHEWRGEVMTKAANFRDYLAFPEDPATPNPGLSYAVTYGDAFFLFLDNTMDSGELFHPIMAFEPPLWVWLNEQVTSEAAQNAKWRFAFFHYPPNSPCQESWGMIIATRDHVIPLLREHGFQAAFAGHVHHYERHDFAGMPVIVTGGGGAGLQNEERCVLPSDTIEFRHTVHHHTTVDLDEDGAFVRAVDVDGEVFDTFRIDP